MEFNSGFKGLNMLKHDEAWCGKGSGRAESQCLPGPSEPVSPYKTYCSSDLCLIDTAIYLLISSSKLATK